MKKFGLLAGALLLIGAGCAPQPAVEDAMMEDDSAMMEETVEGDAMMVPDEDAMEGDAMMEDTEVMEEDAMMEDDSMMELDVDAEVSMDGDVMMAAEHHTFDIGGMNFAFDMDEIRVKKGDTVTINFTSNSGFHDWMVAEFNAATEQVNAGDSSSVTFVADEAGTFEYYCSVGSHRARGMVGKLIVE